jgi:hypothetical protein
MYRDTTAGGRTGCQSLPIAQKADTPSKRDMPELPPTPVWHILAQRKSYNQYGRPFSRQSRAHLAPVQAKSPLTIQTIRLAPTLPTLATMTPGLEKIPEPTCIPTTSPIACQSPTCFSSSLLPASASAPSPERVSGKRSCSNSKPLNDVTVFERFCRGLRSWSVSSGKDSESSSARSERVGEWSPDPGERGGEGEEFASGRYGADMI